jgi:hypothetical protein
MLGARKPCLGQVLPAQDREQRQDVDVRIHLCSGRRNCGSMPSATTAKSTLTTSVSDLRLAIYIIQRLSVSFQDQVGTGDLISRVTDDIEAKQALITACRGF